MVRIVVHLQALPLAADDSVGEFVKILFGAIFVAIWIIGGLLSSTKKRKPQGQKEKSWEEILRDLSGETKRPQAPAPPPPPPAPARQTQRSAPPPLPRQPKRIQRRRPKPVQRVPREVEPPPLPSPAETLTSPAIQQPAFDSSAGILAGEIGSRAELESHRHAVPRAAQIAHALSPRTMRQQFILTEIFQPPRGLREE